jgi:predicted transcriptional regulator
MEKRNFIVQIQRQHASSINLSTMTDSSQPDVTSEITGANTEEEIDEDDDMLIQKAEEEASEERLLNAERLLKRVKNQDLLTPKHHEIIRWANRTEASMKELLQPPDREDSSWTRQSESHGDRDFFVYYRIEKESNKLTCRIESAVESSLLVPVISVFNESDLYKTWMPSWKRPIKLGYRETKMLKESGRGNQVIQVIVDMPKWFSTRETIFHAVAVDVIEESGAIAIQVNTETPEDDPIVSELFADQDV